MKGLSNPTPKALTPEKETSLPLFTKKFSPTFCILGILSITLVLHLHVCEVSFLKAQTRVSGISSITLGHLGLSSSGSSKPLWWKEDLFPFSVWWNSLEGIAYPVCLLKWSTVNWVGQAWFWYKKECFLLELPGLRQHKACFEMESWAGSPSFSRWCLFFHWKDGWHWFSMGYAREIWSPVKQKGFVLTFSKMLICEHTHIHIQEALSACFLTTVSEGSRVALLYPQCPTYQNRAQWVNWWMNEQMKDRMTLYWGPDLNLELRFNIKEWLHREVKCGASTCNPITWAAGSQV